MSRPDLDILDPVLAAAPDAVVTIDEGGRVLGLNPAAEAMFGYNRAEALGRPVSVLVVYEWPSRRFGRRVECRATRADGTEIPVELTVTRTQHEPARFAAWIRDLSASKAAEAESAQLKALFERAEELAQIGSWRWTPATDEMLWSDNLFRLFALEPGELEPSSELVLERTHPDDRSRFEAAIEAARATGELPAIEYRVAWPDGSVLHLRTTGTVEETEEGSSRTLVGSTEDVTAQRRAESEIAAYLAVSEALTRWSSLEEGAERLLRDLLEALGFAVGVLWLPEDDVLVPRIFSCAPAVSVPAFEDATFELRLPSGSGLPGEAWRLRVPVDLATLSPDRPWIWREAAERDGIQAALAIPAVFGEEVLAVIELCSKDTAKLNRRVTRLMTGVGYQLGAFLDRRRGELGAPALTPRQLQILQLAAQGASTPDIASQLLVARSTVKSHFEHIYETLGVSDRAAAVAQAFRQGLIE